MFIKSFYLFVLFPSCTEVMNVDTGICFLFSLHVVVIKLMWIQESVFFPLHVVVVNLDEESVFFPLHVVVMNVDT